MRLALDLHSIPKILKRLVLRSLNTRCFTGAQGRKICDDDDEERRQGLINLCASGNHLDMS